jgi:hypothetical protein
MPKKLFSIILYLPCVLLLLCGCTALGSQRSFHVRSHSKPEEVVRAYIEAILADDCVAATSLVAPERRETGNHRILQECANKEAPFLVSAEIKDVMIEEWDGVTIVTLFGDFYTDLGPQSRYRVYNDQIVYSTEEIDGQWFVKP